jgi:hypothetical protein
MGVLRGLAALGYMVNGAADGLAAGEREKAQKEEQAFQRGQRARMVDQQGRDDRLRDDLADATAPVQAKQVQQDGELTVGANGPEIAQGDQWRTAGTNYPTQDAAAAAVPGASTPTARAGRIQGAYDRAGRPLDGMQARMTSLQGDAAEKQLQDSDEARGHRKFLQSAATSFAEGGWAGFSKFATDQYHDGKIYTAQEDGKGGATIIATDDQGKELGKQTFKSPEDAIMLAASKADPTKWAEWSAGRKDKEADQAYKTRHLDILEKDVQSKGDLRAAQADAAGARAEAAALRARQGGMVAPTAPAPVWDAKADEFLQKRYTVADPTTGALQVDGQGLQFAKAVAVGRARSNGGDFTSALGYAFDIDNALKAKAGNDPEKLRALRNDAMARMQMPAAPAAAPATTDQSPARTPAAPPAPAPAAAPAPSARMPAQTGDKVLNAINDQRIAQLGEAQKKLDAARQMLAAAAPSGDQRSIAHYTQQINAAQAEVDRLSK